MKSHSRSKPIILTVALTGAGYSSERYPNVPLSHQAVETEARRAYEQGARAIHLHARNEKTGLQFSDPEYYCTARKILNASLPGVALSFGSSRKGEVEVDIERRLDELDASNPAGRDNLANVVDAEMVRAGGLAARPDRFTTFTPPEILMAGDIAHRDYEVAIETYSQRTRNTWRDPLAMREYYRRIVSIARATGVCEEIEITTAKSLDVMERIAADPELTLPRETSIVFLFGFSAHLTLDKLAYDTALERAMKICEAVGSIPHITVGAAIHPTFAHPGPERIAGEEMPPGKHDIREIAEWVASDDRVESFRVGLEDSPEMYGRKPSNADLVAHARSVFEELEVAVECNIGRVRQTMGLRKLAE